MSTPMEDRHRDDGFEATFVVSIPRSEAWERLASAAPVIDGIGSARPGQWWIPGVEAPADELSVEPERRLHVRKAVEPCKGTEIVVTMEDADTGTRITFVQCGFGPSFDSARPWLETGWCAIRADLFAYFEHGIALGRHLRPWASLGCDVVESGGGLVVDRVHDGGGAATVIGLASGDLLVLVNGSPVLTTHDLSVLLRSLRSGDSVRVRWVRDGALMNGAGTL